MTCQCTCGKHILIDTSRSVTMFNNAAAAAAAPLFPVTFQANNGAQQPQLINVVANAACAAPAMPNCVTVRVLP